MQEKISSALTASGFGKLQTVRPLHSGDWASVYMLVLKDGLQLAAKVGHTGHEELMAREAEILQFLKQKAPGLFPEVLGLGEGVLLLDFIENDGRAAEAGPTQAGEKLAELHNHSAENFGFEFDTIFGPSPQPNPKTKNWPEFYRDQRLLFMGRTALDAGKIQPGLFGRLETFSAKLERFLPENPKPALLHGDFWGGNILYNKGRLAAFIDPAIYYGDQEVDLAFATLFGSPGAGFFDAYRALRPIEPGFQERIDIYNLWGLLFHAYWFGGGYAAEVEGILKRFGF